MAFELIDNKIARVRIFGKDSQGNKVPAQLDAQPELSSSDETVATVGPTDRFDEFFATTTGQLGPFSTFARGTGVGGTVPLDLQFDFVVVAGGEQSFGAEVVDVTDRSAPTP